MNALRNFLGRLSLKLAPNKGFSVVLVSDAAIARYNSKFRGIQESTDVLAFPVSTEPWEQEDEYLGDIVISVETATRQKEFAGSLSAELKLLSLHGLLHLLGYDHESDHGEMELLEKKLRKEL